MALQPPFFGKRDTESNGLRRPTSMAQPNAHGTPAAGTKRPVVALIDPEPVFSGVTAGN